MEALKSTRFYTLIIVTVLLLFEVDQYSKHIALKNLEYGVIEHVYGYINMFLTYNTGASFSLLSDSKSDNSSFFTTISSAYILILSYLIIRSPKVETLTILGCILCISGSLGNLYDRHVMGYVIDFIAIQANGYSSPIFNIADMFIALGLVLIATAHLKNGIRTS